MFALDKSRAIAQPRFSGPKVLAAALLPLKELGPGSSPGQSTKFRAVSVNEAHPPFKRRSEGPSPSRRTMLPKGSRQRKT